MMSLNGRWNGACHRPITALALAEAAWSEWFAAQSITPLRLTYSALAADPQGAVARVLTHLNLDPARAGALELRTAILRDRQSAEWCARYKSQTGSVG
ncbi:Stf0 family sulfotransferase [Sulfitobacter brevis]|uniref:Stf0 family sulfotransferase n=1 Tax=Sulfitobacter brevis TaxID=74348 RepID=UPI003CCBE2B3